MNRQARALEQPPTHSNFTQRTEGVYALCLIYRVQPSLGEQNCHAFVYLLYGTCTLENFPLYQLQFSFVLFSVKSVLKPCTVVGARQGGVKELSAKNLFQAELLKIFQFYLVMFFVHTNLVPDKIPIHSVLLQHLYPCVTSAAVKTYKLSWGWGGRGTVEYFCGSSCCESEAGSQVILLTAGGMRQIDSALICLNLQPVQSMFHSGQWTL